MTAVSCNAPTSRRNKSYLALHDRRQTLQFINLDQIFRFARAKLECPTLLQMLVTTELRFFVSITEMGNLVQLAEDKLR